MKNIVDIILIMICLLLLLVIYFPERVELTLGEYSIYLRIFSLPIAFIVLFYWLFRFRKDINNRLQVKEKIDTFLNGIKVKHPDWKASRYFTYLAILLLAILFLGCIFYFPNTKRIERRVNIFTEGISANFKKFLEVKAEFYDYTGDLNKAITYYEFLQRHYYNNDLYSASYIQLNQIREKIKTSKYLFRQFRENEQNAKEREGLKLLIFAFALNPGDKTIENALKEYYKTLLLNSAKCRNLIKKSWSVAANQPINLTQLNEYSWYLFDHRLFDHLKAYEIDVYKSRKIQELTQEAIAVDYLNKNDMTWFQDDIKEIMEWKYNLPTRPFL